MITDMAVKKDMVIKAIDMNVDAIYEEQMSLAPHRSGYLRYSLERGRRDISVSDAFDFQVVIDTPVYIRFLDMRRYGNLQIYNRVIWGRLYGDLYGRILKYMALEQGEMKMLLQNAGMGGFQSRSDQYYNGRRNLPLSEMFK